MNEDPSALTGSPRESADGIAFNQTSLDRAQRLATAAADFLVRRRSGEAVTAEAFVAAHPELAPELAEELRRAELIAAAMERAGQSDIALAETHGGRDLDTGGGRLEVRCPSCHTPLEVAVDTQLTDLTCSSCGSHFSLVDQSQATRMAPPLTTIGRFELIERIGMGGFGSVWKARDKELDRTVAVKIPRQGAVTAEEQDKFFREARAAAQLRHPSIVSVHEVGRDGDSVYIVSDFVRGVTLGDWLTGQQLTSRESAELCAKIADALHHAHERGVVHRDLKPANIMIDSAGQPHLMDFGLARRDVGEVTVTIDGQVLGTPAYMSPEQAQGESHKADRRTDVYSLGVILFQLLTGELPFRGNARMLTHQVIDDLPPSPRKFNATVPKDVETITLKCLEKQPDKRYATARELAEELRRYLSGKPIIARPVRWMQRNWRWCRRNPQIAALSILLILALSCGTAVSTALAISARRLAAEHLRERERAEENFSLAQSAVNDYLTSIGEDERLKLGEFYQLRTRLLKSAAPFYERLAKQKPGDAPSEANRARGYAQLAKIHGEMGYAHQAVDEYEQAIAVQSELVAKFPETTNYRRALAEYQFGAGRNLLLLKMTDSSNEAQIQKASRHMEQGVANAVRAAGKEPTRADREALASYHREAGELLRQFGQIEPARAYYEQAIAAYKSLAADYSPTEYAKGLSTCHSELSRVLFSLGENSLGQSHWEESYRVRGFDVGPDGRPRWRQLGQTSSAAEQLGALEPRGLKLAWTSSGSFHDICVDPATPSIYVLGDRTIERRDGTGKTLERFTINADGENLRLANMADDALPEFVVFGSWDHALSARDRRGQTLWTYSQNSSIDDVRAADLDGDGFDEIIVGYNGGTGLHVLDRQGALRWKSTAIGNVWNVTAGRFMSADAMHVLTTSAAGQVHVFDASGNAVKNIKLGLYAHNLRAIPAPAGATSGALVGGVGDAGESLVLIDNQGAEHWERPLSSASDHISSLTFDAAGRLAMVGMRSGWILVLGVETGQPVAALQLQGARDPATALFSPRGEPTLALAATDNKLVAFEVVGSVDKRRPAVVTLASLLGDAAELIDSRGRLEQTASIQARLRQLDNLARQTRDSPDSEKLQQDLAAAYAELADLLEDGEGSADARTAFEKAMDIRSKLALQPASSTVHKKELANSHVGYGQLLSRQGDQAGARKQLGRAVAIMSKLVAESREQRGEDDLETLALVRSLADTYEAVDNSEEAIKLCLKYGLYTDALRLAARDSELLNLVVVGAGSADVQKLRRPIDVLVVGELRLIAGDAGAAETAIRTAMNRGSAQPFVHKSLGWCLLAQGKTEVARRSFEQALASRRQADGTFELEQLDPDELTAAYFLDLVVESHYVGRFSSNQRLAGFPWFYVGQRREIEGNQAAAATAYNQSVELGKQEGAHTVSRLAQWSLQKLGQAPQPRPQ